MSTPKFWIVGNERVLQDADKALAHALDRLVPVIEDHELEHIRDELRSRGFDVLPLIREGDADKQRLRSALRQIRDAGLGPDRGSAQWTADLCRNVARSALESAT